MNLTKITDRHNTDSLKWLYSSLFTISLLANDKIIALIIYISRKLMTNIIAQSLQSIKFNYFCAFSFFLQLDKKEEDRRELRPALVSGNVTGDDPVSYWSIFSLPW